MRNKMVLVMMLAVIFMAAAVHAAQQAPPIPSEEEPEVLTQGPVNEAFAQPVDLENQTGFVAPSEPPPGIAEVPPAERPQDDHYAWIPGYWAWDTDRNGYIWVSGCWRAVPPGMSWVPGYWAPTAGGWRWVSGFWAPVDSGEIEYLPPPPALADIDPPGPPPVDRIWVPPCWYWQHGGYVRRPGYWLAAQPDWVWVPSSYVWTPRGHVFVRGHWDYDLGRRGLLFAPVYFPRPIYRRPGYAYALSIVVDLGGLQFGLFTRPRYRHYYFGDYYDSGYVAIGIFPWFEFERRRGWYDPIYVHDRWRHHRDPRWEQDQRQAYDRRRNDRSLRPPRTYREMEQRAGRLPASRRGSVAFAAPVSRIADARKTPFRITPAKPEHRQQLSRHADEVRNYSQERRQWESQNPRKSGSPPLPAPAPAAVPSKKKPLTGRDAQKAERAADRRSPSGNQAQTGWEENRDRNDAPAAKPEQAAQPPRPPQALTPPADSGRRQGHQYQPPENAGKRAVPPAETGYNGSDRVKFRTPPVTGQPGDAFKRKKHPKWPEDEKKRME